MSSLIHGSSHRLDKTRLDMDNISGLRWLPAHWARHMFVQVFPNTPTEKLNLPSKKSETQHLPSAEEVPATQCGGRGWVFKTHWAGDMYTGGNMFLMFRKLWVGVHILVMDNIDKHAGPHFGILELWSDSSVMENMERNSR